MKLNLRLQEQQPNGDWLPVRINDVTSITNEKQKIFVSASGGISRMFELERVAGIAVYVVQD